MTIATIRLIRPFCLSKISSDMNIGLIFMRYKRINKQRSPTFSIALYGFNSYFQICIVYFCR